MDLIAGLPRDDPESFRRTLDQVISLSPENVTVHTLSLKKGSAITLGKTALPSAEEVSQMLDDADVSLRKTGYSPYYLYRQKDTGHAQSRMVTDVYSHSFDEDRKHLARKVEEQFFGGKQKKQPQPPDVDASTQQAMKLVESSPEMARAFLQMAQLMGNKE